MLSSLIEAPFVWGFMGAFVYAAPRLSACVFAARQTGVGWFDCGFEFVVALATGAVAAAALGPEITISVLKTTDPAHARAVASGIGLLANPAAPKIIDILTGRILQVLKGSDK